MMSTAYPEDFAMEATAADDDDDDDAPLLLPSSSPPLGGGADVPSSSSSLLAPFSSFRLPVPLLPLSPPGTRKTGEKGGLEEEEWARLALDLFRLLRVANDGVNDGRPRPPRSSLAPHDNDDDDFGEGEEEMIARDQLASAASMLSGLEASVPVEIGSAATTLLRSLRGEADRTALRLRSQLDRIERRRCRRRKEKNATTEKVAKEGRDGAMDAIEYIFFSDEILLGGRGGESNSRGCKSGDGTNSGFDAAAESEGDMERRRATSPPCRPDEEPSEARRGGRSMSTCDEDDAIDPIEFERWQKEQLESELADMASRLRDSTLQMNRSLAEQSGDLDGLEDLASKNLDDVGETTRKVTERLNRGWAKALWKWSTLFGVVGIWIFVFLVTRTIPKRRVDWDGWRRRGRGRGSDGWWKHGNAREDSRRRRESDVRGADESWSRECNILPDGTQVCVEENSFADGEDARGQSIHYKEQLHQQREEEIQQEQGKRQKQQQQKNQQRKQQQNQRQQQPNQWGGGEEGLGNGAEEAYIAELAVGRKRRRIEANMANARVVEAIDPSVSPSASPSSEGGDGEDGRGGRAVLKKEKEEEARSESGGGKNEAGRGEESNRDNDDSHAGGKEAEASDKDTINGNDGPEGLDSSHLDAPDVVRAANDGDIDALRHIFSVRPDLLADSFSDDNGWRPLHHAAVGGHAAVVEYLLDKQEADVNARTTLRARGGRDGKAMGGTALWWAFELGADRNDAAVRLLEERGGLTVGPWEHLPDDGPQSLAEEGGEHEQSAELDKRRRMEEEKEEEAARRGKEIRRAEKERLAELEERRQMQDREEAEKRAEEVRRAEQTKRDQFSKLEERRRFEEEEEKESARRAEEMRRAEEAKQKRLDELEKKLRVQDREEAERRAEQVRWIRMEEEKELVERRVKEARRAEVTKLERLAKLEERRRLEEEEKEVRRCAEDARQAEEVEQKRLAELEERRRVQEEENAEKLAKYSRWAEERRQLDEEARELVTLLDQVERDAKTAMDRAKEHPADHLDFSASDVRYSAARSKNDLLSYYFLKSPDLVDAPDFSGWRPIHEAARGGNIVGVQLLVKKGCDLTARTGRSRKGGTALWWAIQRYGEDHSVVKVLRSHNALDQGPDEE